jgi:hypothetical protein
MASAVRGGSLTKPVRINSSLGFSAKCHLNTIDSESRAFSDRQAERIGGAFEEDLRTDRA